MNERVEEILNVAALNVTCLMASAVSLIIGVAIGMVIGHWTHP